MSSRQERKVVTVLFCDLVGFTAQAESMDPEDVAALLAGYHDRVRHQLERHGGTVEKFIGDAVMALFGAPTAHEDDPERAVRAAFAVRDEEELTVRIGITTGEALVTLGGETTAAGDVVNTASRLQSAAPENGVLVDETTYRATARAIEYREADAVEAKGKTESLPVWEAVQARARFGVDVPQDETRTPLVGRQDELGALVAALGRARKERAPQLVTLVGVPGIGKSRLVHELFQSVERDPELITWRQGRSLPYGEGVTFWALAEMVKAQAGVLETDSAEEAETRLRAAIAGLREDQGEARWVEAHLRPLVGLGGEAELGGDRRAEAFSAWRRFLEALAEERPLVLVFEDLHWADEGLLDFVDYLADWASEVPLLVVCTARPDLLAKRPGWGGGKPNALTISLSALTEDETARLVHALLERAVLPAELQATLLERAGGNPLYAEEFARMVAERGSLGDGELSLPESLQGLIAARLDALSTEEKALVQDAAVLGKVFWPGALAALGGRDRWALEEALHALERKQFLRRERRSSVAGETQHAFLHLLVRDVAYGQIPRGERAGKHRLAAEWIESLAADRSEDRAEMLAHHYLNAVEFARASGQDTAPLLGSARSALIEAGDRASGLDAFPTAASFYSAALALGDERDPELVLRAAEARYYLEGSGEELLTEARDGLLARGDHDRAARAEMLLARLARERGEAEPANRAFERAIELLREEPPSRTKAEVLLARASAQLNGGDADSALRGARDALRIAEELGFVDLQAGALVRIGGCRSMLGEEGALGDLRRGIDLAVQRNSPLAITGYISLADELIEDGDLERGFAARVEARRVAERLGVALGIEWVRGERPGELYTLGRWDDALRLADEFVEWSASGPGHYMESPCRQVRGGILLARGEVDRALEDARISLQLGREAMDPQALYPALAFAARVYLTTGRANEASPLLDELLERVRESNQAPMGYVWLRSAATSMRAIGRGRELLQALAGVPRRTAWLEAATELAAGDFVQAAERYAALGARPDEAFARLAAADALTEAGRHAEGEAQRKLALAFLESVGVTRHQHRAELPAESP